MNTYFFSYDSCSNIRESIEIISLVCILLVSIITDWGISINEANNWIIHEYLL
jgi:hypothetical protein